MARPLAYQQAFPGGEEVPKTAFQIPTSAAVQGTGTRTLFQDTCIAAMAAFIQGGREGEFGSDADMAYRVTQVAREMTAAMEKYGT